MVIREADLDINIMEVPLVWTVQQHEINSRQINLSITEDGQKFNIPTGSKVILKMLRPDKKVTLQLCSFSGNIVNIALESKMMLYSGICLCKLSIVQNANTSLTSPKNILDTANYILDTVSFKIKIDEDNINGYELAD